MIIFLKGCENKEMGCYTLLKKTPRRRGDSLQPRVPNGNDSSLARVRRWRGCSADDDACHASLLLYGHVLKTKDVC